ncbi:hypothetical protein ACSBR1_007326 [Camellia fascicularis]
MIGFITESAEKIFSPPLFQAISTGIHEIVEAILRSYPNAIHLRNKKKQSIFHHAVVCRRENVFNPILQVEESKTTFLSQWDESKNNALHLAGYLAPQKQLYRRAGAALQMQRELQWFKEVEKHVVPRNKEERNYDGMTPAEVFTDKHKELVKEGEQWMKDTANACSIVAALIATVVFAAAITVPGGNNGNGGPIFNKRASFLIFGIFDAFALFSSMTSVLLFLSILTSRYAEDDFLVTLPRRLIYGLLTLFLSILSTMIAFGATLYLVFEESYKAWIIIPVFVLPGIPDEVPVSLSLPVSSPDEVPSSIEDGFSALSPEVPDVGNLGSEIPGLDSAVHSVGFAETSIVSSLAPTDLEDASQEQGTSLGSSVMELVPSISTDRSEELSPKAAVTDVSSRNSLTVTSVDPATIGQSCFKPFDRERERESL